MKQEFCFSSGLTTYEVEPNSKTKIHNQITEGFVEATARAMVLAVDGNIQDIDIGKYYEMVEIAKKIIISRDENVGEDGKTYADFLMHSSTLKQDLESKIVDGKVDGLHYISDYADTVHCDMTPKRKLYKVMGKIAGHLGIDKNSPCARAIEEMDMFCKESFTSAEINELKNLLMSGKTPEEDYVDSVIKKLVTYTEEEKKFFDGISKKLGYRQKNIESKKSTQALGKETLEQQKDVGLIDEIEEEEQKLYIDKSNNIKDSNNLGEL